MVSQQIAKTVQRMESPEMRAVLTIQSHILKATADFMFERKVLQLMPVIISPVTDPLCHSVFDAQIDYYGQKFFLTKSMILHKQVSLIPKDRKAIYIVSPNVRLEKKELAATGRHLIEFSQVDFEFKDAESKEVMGFMEELTTHIFGFVSEHCKAELETLGRDLKIPRSPFKVYDSDELREKYGADFEHVVSLSSKEPFWIVSYCREFYDREDPSRPGKYLNYDLVYPEGFGEALSGGEREHEYERVLAAMKKRGMSPGALEFYLSLAKSGLLPKSAGAGFGVERMVRYISGIKDIGDVSLFAKKPGEKVMF